MPYISEDILTQLLYTLVMALKSTDGVLHAYERMCLSHLAMAYRLCPAIMQIAITSTFPCLCFRNQQRHVQLMAFIMRGPCLFERDLSRWDIATSEVASPASRH
jgi:hypothetical protein